MTSSLIRGGLCSLTLALSLGIANAAAQSGDRVLVADGIYFEHDISVFKAVEIRSESDNPKGGEVEAEFILKNTGTAAEDNATITSVSLSGKTPKGKLPKNLGTIKAGKKEDAEFEFKGVRRGTYTLTLSGTSSTGSFSFTQTVTIW